MTCPPQQFYTYTCGSLIPPPAYEGYDMPRNYQTTPSSGKVLILFLMVEYLPTYLSIGIQFDHTLKDNNPSMSVH